MEFTLHGVPLEFRWTVTPVECGLTDGVLSATSGPQTDIFVHPAGTTTVMNAPRALAPPPDGDWQFSARVRVEFRDAFDAGVLLLWSDETHWAKLCFERSPAGVPMVVSVVCRDVADDANSWPVTGDHVWLRVSRVGGAYAFHASADGSRWEFVRHFALPSSSVGFVVQAPVGAGCSAVFDYVSFVTGAPADLRDGS
jgi:regulation of enolase protein 1 (concanavalin A-like superfamily)